MFEELLLLVNGKKIGNDNHTFYIVYNEKK